MPAARLLSVGEAFEDLVFVGLPRLPGPGEEVRTTRLSSSLGGGAIITAVAAARLGLPVAVASGLSDKDAAALRAEGIAVTNLRRPGERHAITAALSTTGERAFVTFDGVNSVLEPRIARVLAAARARHVHLAFYPRNCASWARRIAALRRRDVTTSWDFGWNDVLARDPALPTLIDALTIVFINEQEAALYGGGADDAETSVPFWRARKPIVVMKLGKKGSRTVGSAGEWFVPAPAVKAVDTTGAGDAFNGGFLVSWLAGAGLRECLTSGNRIGAASTTKPGGVQALPRRKVRS